MLNLLLCSNCDFCVCYLHEIIIHYAYLNQQDIYALQLFKVFIVPILVNAKVNFWNHSLSSVLQCCLWLVGWVLTNWFLHLSVWSFMCSHSSVINEQVDGKNCISSNESFISYGQFHQSSTPIPCIILLWINDPYIHCDLLFGAFADKMS